MTLSLTQIIKNGLDDLKRLEPLVKPFINEWVVVLPPGDKAVKWAQKHADRVILKDFTTPIEPDIRKQMLDYGLDVPKDYRLFNFAAAREASVEAASSEYCLWLDADDEPVGLDKLRDIIKGSPEVDIFECVYDYARDEEGNSISDQIRERVFKKTPKLKWKGGELGLIHETLIPDDSFTPMTTLLEKDEFYVKHLSDHPDESSMRNHIALLYEYLKTEGKDARTTYYLGVEFFNRGMYEQCIKVMREYIAVGGWDEERYRAYIRMGEAYAQLNDLKSARNSFLAAIDELPHYPDAYLAIGETYYTDKNWAKCIEFTMTGLQKKVPSTKSAIDMPRYTFRPATFIALAYLDLGKPGDAYSWFKKAYAMNPKHPFIKQYSSLFQEAKDLNDYVMSFVKLGQIAKRRYPQTLHKLTEVIPDDLKDQELLLDFKRRFTKPKIWSEKSIVVFASQAFEDWGPDSLEKGTGGSEEQVIQLTKRWVKMGWEVTVYNNCPQEKTVEGVAWKRFEHFNPRDVFNIVIGWRNNPFLEPVIASKKFIDMHDIPTLKFFPEEELKDVKIMVKSHYHRSLFTNLGESNFVIIPNGIDMEQFDATPKKTKNNLCWTSSYDRGLQHLLEMWPDVLKKVPDATLDIAYGFNLYDSSTWGQKPAGQLWKQKMLKLMEQPGITHHGRLKSDEVAKLYLKADVFAYPTRFPEIDCISLTKAMAAKAVPITTDYAVLPERNLGIEIKGDINTPEVQEKFKENLISLLQDEDLKQEIRDTLDVEEYNLDSIASRWHMEFER